VYDALTRDRVSEVETINREMQKALLQVSSVFREEPEDSDIIPRVLSQLKVEERSESPWSEMKKRKKAKKLGSKQPECHPHKSQLVKPRAENRTKLMCLKKDVSFEELEHKIEKLATQTNNTCAEMFEIRKGNKTMRKKLDKIFSILENEKREKETQDDKMGLLVSSLEDMDFGGKVESITMGEHTDISSRNEVKADVQHLSDDTVTGTKEINAIKKENTEMFPVRHDKTSWHLHSDMSPGVSTAREENIQKFTTHKKAGVQPHSEQVLILADKDSDVRKRETPEKNDRQCTGVGLQVLSDQNVSFEDDNSYAMTEDQRVRTRNVILIQKLNVLLDCIKADDGVSKHFVRHIQQIIEENKSVSPPVIKKLIDTITTRCQPSVLFHRMMTKLGSEAVVGTCSVLYNLLNPILNLIS
jgi:hypothetical protein